MPVPFHSSAAAQRICLTPSAPSAQVTTVLMFDAAAPDSPTWRSVAAVASALNRTKWALCRAGAFTFLLTSLAAAALALKEQAMRARKRNE